MKNITSIFVVLSLVGCSTTIGVERNFPEPPPELMKKCEKLLSIEGENVAITDMLKTVVENYKLYYSCSNKVDGWQEWHQEQKKIFEEVK
jgi:hypothetical protein